MPELKRVFTSGKMNKDLDERLVPNGQYRDALNVQVSNSEGSDVGAIESVLGNTAKSSFNFTNATCIGNVKDTQNNKIYWFVTADEGDFVLEYNETNEVVSFIIVDYNGVLNFSIGNLITGVNIFDGMLMWTDDLNEPRKILISRFKSGTNQTGQDHTTVYGRDFIASDVTVIKKKPNERPHYVASSTTRSGVGSGLNYVTAQQDFTELYNGSKVPREVGSTIAFTVSDSPNWNAGDIIVLTASEINDNNYEDEYQVRIEVVSITGALLRFVTGTIQSISSDIKSIEYTWKCILEEERPMFELSFPRFAYRWRYIDSEVSGFSPWTNAVFVPGDFRYISMDAYNTGMVNNLRQLTISGFETPPADVEYIEILYKDSSSPNVYKVESIPTTRTSYSITSELISNLVESSQLLRAYDNVPLKAKSQEVIGNRLVYGNYVQGYNITDEADITVTLQSNSITSVKTPESSIKSLRNYQVGIVYLDTNGRETPVFTNDYSTLKVDIDKSSKVNRIKAESGQDAPSWATHFKYYVKDISNEYYNIVLDRYYADDSDGTVWLSIPSAERNKVQEGDFLTLKKKHNSDEPVISPSRYKILDIQNEVPDAVSIKRVYNTASEVVKGSDTTVANGLKTFKFEGPTSAENPEFFESFDYDSYIRFRRGTNVSQFYEIERGGYTGDTHDCYEITTKEKLTDVGFIQSLSSSDKFTVEVYKKEKEARKEYQGRFFVKINRDVLFEESVIYNFTNNPSDYEQDGLKSVPYIQSTLADDPDATDTPPAALDMFAWEEHTNAEPSIDSHGQPTVGSDLFGFYFAPYDSGNVDFGTNGNAFDAAISSGDVIQFQNSTDNSWSSLYVVDTVTKGTYDRQPLSSGDTDDETGYYWNIKMTTPFTDEDFTADAVRISKRKRLLPIVFDENTITLSSPNPTVFEVEPNEAIDLDIFFEATEAIPIAQLQTEQVLDYFNVYSFGNGVESNRIRDDFNAKTMGKGVKASSTIEEVYSQERRGHGMIYSGIFNSTSGVNNLNQFNTAEKITKDLNPIYGTIQKLHARDTDLIVLCEDKVFRVLANKDALYNADGNANLVSTNRVLGQSTPYVGEYGISKNPESFVSFGFRAYFVDKSRRAVIRLSRDGITDVASKGMSDFITDALTAHSGAIHGSFNEDMSSYNVTVNGETLAFKESVDGWSTRLSFVPETGVSLNSVYYTFKNGNIYAHTNNTRANYYGIQYDTSVTLLHNDEASRIKNFKTLSYEGDSGWTATVDTDQQDGEVVTWKNKEGIYYNYIRGRQDAWDNNTQSGSLDTSEFSVQGIDTLDIIGTVTPTMRLIFNNEINVSLQEAADDIVFYQKSNGNIYKIGTCADIGATGGQYYVDVNNTENIEYDNGGTSIEDGDFIFFAKNSQINTSGLVGYYASVKMTNTTGTNKELFAVNSEIFVSS